MAEGSGPQKTWLVVGASRGIGKAFVDQLLAKGNRVIATVRGQASEYWPDQKDRCTVLNCDVAVEKTINFFVEQLSTIPDLKKIDYVVINAGILVYPNRATGESFDGFTRHLTTNTVGPIICAQRLLKSGIPIGTIVFMSSDSGSQQAFRHMEDGFAAYAASKTALNMAARHMDAELKRKGTKTSILCLHPGEVETDMTRIDINWEVEAEVLTPEQSAKQSIEAIESKRYEDSGTFFTYDNRVSRSSTTASLATLADMIKVQPW